MSRDEFLNLFGKGKPVYLLNEFEQAVVKFDGFGNVFVKFKGEPEFKAVQGSGVVSEALLDEKLITEDDYNNW
jgi:hypothetical protein